MKSVLSAVLYNHFLCLSVAIRILIDPQLCVMFNAYANFLLLWFVSHFGNIYGDQYLSYNIHNLFHLANDVRTFGSLDNFSCFKYENHMQKIKKNYTNLVNLWRNCPIVYPKNYSFQSKHVSKFGIHLLFTQKIMKFLMYSFILLKSQEKNTIIARYLMTILLFMF